MSSLLKASQVLLVIFIFLVLVCSCVFINYENDFEISDFNALSNFIKTPDTVTIPMDLNDALFNGIVLPSLRQSKSGYFSMRFAIKNNSGKPQTFYYKIFYQNETYKIKEFTGSEKNKIYNPLSGNNFYGSWENPEDTFHQSKVIPFDNQWYIVTDSFRIVGNPRNELKYYGFQPENVRLSDRKVIETMEYIRSIPEWYDKIKEKAVAGNLPVEDQLLRDAIWSIKNSSQKSNENNRWKRNPRVGVYSFLLVVTDKENINLVPESVKHIEKNPEGLFLNPYFDLLYNTKLNNDKYWFVRKSSTSLKTWIELDPGAGIYYNETNHQKFVSDTLHYSRQCGNSDHLFKTAHFEQYFHNIDQNVKLHNIPIAADVIGDPYMQADYLRNASRYDSSKLIIDHVYISECPCKTVSSDPWSKSISIINPGQVEGQLKKENVGVNSRIGLTYGRYIAKIAFPEIINSENVWNGLTCAFWLKFQDENEWNYRSSCPGEGYVDYSGGKDNRSRVGTTYYTEIDFEILKTSQYWPKSSYNDPELMISDDPEFNHDIIVTCTNWDLACRVPVNFSIGATDFYYGNNKYVVHRWDDWYRALTIKTPANHDSIFGRCYYYEIDWQPDRIIWRIGKDRKSMIEIGAMDSTITTIPDNQMVMVFTQEFHCADWWPLSPFIQDLIPFPKNDIVGKILEAKIE